MHKIDFSKKAKKLKDRRAEERNTLRYKKLIAAAVNLVVKNNSLRYTKDDIKTISLSIYKSYNKLKHIRVWNQLTSEITKQDINKALIDFYAQAGLTKDESIKMLNLAKDTAIEKKDVNNLLKIVEKYESAANLTHKNTITARTTETIDYSKVGKDGQPAQKVVKTLELTKNESIGSDISLDNGKGNDNVQPNNPD